MLTACAHPPRLDVPRANEQRAIVNPATPTDKERDIEGTLGEEKDDLAAIARKAKAGDSIDVKLGPGTFVIDKPIVVKGASLVIRGPGAEKTRIKLNSDDWRALTVEGSPSFELRGVTVAGYTGGGIDAQNCARVVINECDFAGSRYGVELQGCGAAYVDSCVFAGCEKAIAVHDSHLVLRSTAITDCWTSLEGSALVECSGCIFGSNEYGAKITLRDGSSFRSCLFGRLETFDTIGDTDVRSSFVFDDLYERFHLEADRDENVILREIYDFPNAVTIPRGCNMGAIHYALERSRDRATVRPRERIHDVLLAETLKYARAAEKAIATGKKEDRGSARFLQQIALDYLQATGGHEEALRARILGIVP